MHALPGPGDAGAYQRRSFRADGPSRYRVGMALATPAPADGATENVDDGLVGSSLPAAEAELLAPVIAAFLRRHPGDDTSIIVRAAETATVAHAGQMRRSGEPYVTHPIAVADIAADLGLDEATITAALLHLSLIHI